MGTINFNYNFFQGIFREEGEFKIYFYRHVTIRLFTGAPGTTVGLREKEKEISQHMVLKCTCKCSISPV